MKPSGDRGSLAVEFALVVPVLLLLVFGIAEFGRAYNTQTTLAGAARAGARVMAIQNDPAAATVAVQTAAGSLNVTSAQIGISPVSCATSGTTPPPTVTVTVTYRLAFITKLFGSGVTITVRGVMRCNG